MSWIFEDLQLLGLMIKVTPIIINWINILMLIVKIMFLLMILLLIKLWMNLVFQLWGPHDSRFLSLVIHWIMCYALTGENWMLWGSHGSCSQGSNGLNLCKMRRILYMRTTHMSSWNLPRAWELWRKVGVQSYKLKNNTWSLGKKSNVC